MNDDINVTISENISIDATVTEDTPINATIVGYASSGSVGNLGTGEGIYATKDGSEFKLKSLKAGSNISLTSTAEEITIGTATSLKYESFVMRAIDLSNKYVEISGEIADNQSIRVFIDNVGIKAEQGIDYSVSGNQIIWNGFELENLLELGDTLNIFYVGNN